MWSLVPPCRAFSLHQPDGRAGWTDNWIEGHSSECSLGQSSTKNKQERCINISKGWIVEWKSSFFTKETITEIKNFLGRFALLNFYRRTLQDIKKKTLTSSDRIMHTTRNESSFVRGKVSCQFSQLQTRIIFQLHYLIVRSNSGDSVVVLMSAEQQYLRLYTHVISQSWIRRSGWTDDWGTHRGWSII